jgi:hypothetical protein
LSPWQKSAKIRQFFKNCLDPLIIQLKLSCPFSVLMIFTLFTIVFWQRLAVFSLPWQKTTKIWQIFYTVGFINGPILLIECVPMDRWPSVREVFYD